MIFWIWYQKYKQKNLKNNQIGLHQLRSFCTAKETVNKLKRQPKEWEEIFASHTSKKPLKSKICEELIHQ